MNRAASTRNALCGYLRKFRFRIRYDRAHDAHGTAHTGMAHGRAAPAIQHAERGTRLQPSNSGILARNTAQLVEELP